MIFFLFSTFGIENRYNILSQQQNEQSNDHQCSTNSNAKHHRPSPPTSGKRHNKTNGMEFILLFLFFYHQINVQLYFWHFFLTRNYDDFKLIDHIDIKFGIKEIMMISIINHIDIKFFAKHSGGTSGMMTVHYLIL